MFVYFFFFETEFLYAALVVWNLPCREGYPETQRSACFYFQNAGIKGTPPHLARPTFYNSYFRACGCLCGSTALVSRSLWRPEGGTGTRITHDCELPRGCRESNPPLNGEHSLPLTTELQTFPDPCKNISLYVLGIYKTKSSWVFLDGLQFTMLTRLDLNLQRSSMC